MGLYKKETPLNEYHKKRNEEGIKEVEEMLKRPYSRQRMIDQKKRLGRD